MKALEQVPRQGSYSSAAGRHPERTQELVARYSVGAIPEGASRQPPLRSHAASYDGVPVDRNHSRCGSWSLQL